MSAVFSIPTPKGPGDQKRLGQVIGSSTGLLIEQISRQHTGMILLISQDMESAERLMQEVRFFCGDRFPATLLPDWETLPYDSFSPHQDIISSRIQTLHQLPDQQRGVLVVPASTLMHRLPPVSFVSANALFLETGQRLDSIALRQRFTDAGYHAVDTVYEHGEFAIRGAIIDLFPMGADQPLRIDLFDDEIDTIRTFDPETQRSIDKVERIRLLPAREFPFDQNAITRFKQRWRERFDVDHTRCPIYQDVSSGLTPPGVEYYAPLFFDDTATLFDYLPDSTLVLHEQALKTAADQFCKDARSRYDERSGDLQRPVLSPDELFLSTEELFTQLKNHPVMRLSQDPEELKPGRNNLPCLAPAELGSNDSQSPLAGLQGAIKEHPLPTLICAESAGRREALIEHARKAGLKLTECTDWDNFVTERPSLAITTFPLELGLTIDGELRIVTESQLFGRQIFQRRRREKEQIDADQAIRHLSELSIGAPVVHIDHGVGRYLGLQTINVDNQAAEFLVLEYADQAKLYVPVSSLHLIGRYSGASDESAPLHKLGTEQWNKARRKAAEKVRDSAAELLDIYARRAARKGFSFDCTEEEYLRFSASFPFEETPDQANAINAVVNDMRAPSPMDRLVCGDVGFGKTEVAMRAAFIAIQSGKQVAVLVPTTLLAQQHFENFRDRFADWPVEVELISRFKSAKQQQSTIEALGEGKVDILIGTHKLLQGDIRFSDLGLLIIDEEHRFGVQQKERLKSLRSEVDILTLTATPIPRTLNMAMSGIRDLSIIATPPARRLSIKTFVRQSERPMIKEAILRELLRGGQVYYLHNEVKTIDKVAAEISDLVPEARVAIGHGQMRERELEQVMSDFYHKRFNVLVCTTIIETGIDVPSANTIIIDRADKFGLAQLHQLRGRVGRSHHQAYAYLLTPPPKAMTQDALKRLEAIGQSSTLGAGFTLATHDLEIRGAGELLGEEQSGQMQSVGFSLYMEMLDQAIKSIQEGKTPDLDKPLHHGCEINLNLPALIPEDYIPDVHNRLILYKRIANAENDSALDELQVEMIDRFGLLPEPTKNLLRLTHIKLRAETLGIVKLDAGDKSGRIEFEAEPNVDPMTLITMIQRQPDRFRLDGGNILRFTQPMEKVASRFEAVERLLTQLSPKENS
ncbi:transcription-repair coupling factor [Marinobacterium sediminicola]|uniref:Transcription-repair-coupling factor n=1 Tax=Marinobacterium sediminicola TaxID=518898 RepID=A0ABY1RX49_9GAMM|nr:transcription-repair coupling factor [Marinobacterium sediminicola]ULG67859.1 transcription-repair coupling factor [Marinobacterium sediminicola]SMR71457.1 transcription-repair coupling factor (superfamily II helicase) [Marinobacterium sediminicola]